MSQATHPTLSTGSPLRAHRVAALSALLALVATAAVVLVLTIDGGSSGVVSEHQQPVGGLPETAVAASIAPQPSAGPDESNIAASIGGPKMLPSGPDESAVAASIAGR